MLVTFQNVSFQWPNGHQQIKHINLSLSQKCYGLVGVNGVGKTTLARLIIGDLLVAEGRVQVEGAVYLQH